MTTVMKDLFRQPLFLMISYLRRQSNVRAKMGSECPPVSQTRLLSICSVTKWLSRHRSMIVSYLEGHNQSVCLDAEWWVFNAAMKIFINLIDKYSIALQGQDTLVPEHNARIEKPIDEIRWAVNIEEPLHRIDLLPVVGNDSVAAHMDTDSDTYLFRE